MKTLTDQSHMIFGKYGPGKGDYRRLCDLPAQYVLWIWEDAELWNKAKLKANLESAQRIGNPEFIAKAEDRLALHNYIANKSTFKALEMDAPDVIVRHWPE